MNEGHKDMKELADELRKNKDKIRANARRMNTALQLREAQRRRGG